LKTREFTTQRLENPRIHHTALTPVPMQKVKTTIGAWAKFVKHAERKISRNEIEEIQGKHYVRRRRKFKTSKLSERAQQQQQLKKKNSKPYLENQAIDARATAVKSLISLNEIDELSAPLNNRELATLETENHLATLNTIKTNGGAEKPNEMPRVNQFHDYRKQVEKTDNSIPALYKGLQNIETDTKDEPEKKKPSSQERRGVKRRIPLGGFGTRIPQTSPRPAVQHSTVVTYKPHHSTLPGYKPTPSMFVTVSQLVESLKQKSKFQMSSSFQDAEDKMSSSILQQGLSQLSTLVPKFTTPSPIFTTLKALQDKYPSILKDPFTRSYELQATSEPDRKDNLELKQQQQQQQQHQQRQKEYAYQRMRVPKHIKLSTEDQIE